MVRAADTSHKERLEALHERMARHSLSGHWQPRQRTPVPEAWLWPWEEIYGCLMESGEVVRLGADTARRTVQLMNPALTAQKSTSKTLQMSVQLVKPGEIAECHRHTAAALRFVVQGRGTFTTVEGERFFMEPGDLILTPSWTWHEHTNETDEPIVWLDVLDSHLVGHLDAAFQEPYPAEHPQTVTKPDGYSVRRFGPARPRQDGIAGAPPYNYKWAETEQALHEMAGREAPDPYDGLLLEYKNPLTGGPTMPTIGSNVQLLQPGEITRAHRHTSLTIYHAVRGSGTTVIEGKPYQWNERDCFIVPSWKWHEHRNRSSDEAAVLFSVTDRPVLLGLGLFREEGN